MLMIWFIICALIHTNVFFHYWSYIPSYRPLGTHAQQVEVGISESKHSFFIYLIVLLFLGIRMTLIGGMDLKERSRKLHGVQKDIIKERSKKRK